MLCVSCGKLTGDSGNCEHCGAPLPKAAPPPYQNGPIAEMFRMAADWDSGALDRSSIEGLIAKRKALYESVLSDIDKMTLPEDVRAEAAEELKIGRLGVVGLIQALDCFAQYVNGGGSDSFEQAVLLTKNATDMVNKAARLNWDSFQNLKSSAEEILTLTSQGV